MDGWLHACLGKLRQTDGLSDLSKSISFKFGKQMLGATNDLINQQFSTQLLHAMQMQWDNPKPAPLAHAVNAAL